MGAYSEKEYNRFLVSRLKGAQQIFALIASRFPMVLANFVVVTYFLFLKRSASLALYDLLKTKSSSFASKLLARLIGVVV
jgi:hypothetical protein